MREHKARQAIDEDFKEMNPKGRAERGVVRLALLLGDKSD